jgi:hypothetical protein
VISISISTPVAIALLATIAAGLFSHRRRTPRRRLSPESASVLAKAGAARRQLAETDAKLARTRTRR